jgi:hypothetical protein
MDEASYLTNIPLVHDECGCSVFIDIGGAYNLLATPILTEGVIRITYADFVAKAKPKKEFSCPECQKKVELDAILGVCSLCYQKVDTKKLCRCKQIERYICPACAEAHAIEIMPRTTLYNLLVKYLNSEGDI